MRIWRRRRTRNGGSRTGVHEFRRVFNVLDDGYTTYAKTGAYMTYVKTGAYTTYLKTGVYTTYARTGTYTMYLKTGKINVYAVYRVYDVRNGGYEQNREEDATGIAASGGSLLYPS
ncbi:hypothetical protein PI125_g7053 [Phytophthora idaei]|nr:hypothetical protein PI125_g7053 [Phytophthora idaei]